MMPSGTDSGNSRLLSTVAPLIGSRSVGQDLGQSLGRQKFDVSTLGQSGSQGHFS